MALVLVVVVPFVARWSVVVVRLVVVMAWV